MMREKSAPLSCLCPDCGQDLPLDAYRRDKRKPTGYRLTRCKVCQKKVEPPRARPNRNAYHAAWRAAHPERVAEYKEREKTKRTSRAVYHAEWVKRNPERVAEYKRRRAERKAKQ